MKDCHHLLLLPFLSLLVTIRSQRIPQSFFQQPAANTSQPIPSAYFRSLPNYDHPNQRPSQHLPQQTVPYQPIPYTPHQIAAYDPVQNLNQIGRVDQVQSYDQTNPYANDNPALNLGPLNQARVPIVNDPNLVQIAQYSNPQIPDILRNSILTNVPHIDNQLNYNLISPNVPNQGAPLFGQNPNQQSPLTPSGYSPHASPNYSNGNPPQGVSFQPFNPYAGLFNESSQTPQKGFPQQHPHFSYSNSNGPQVNASNLYPFGQGGPQNQGWFQSTPNAFNNPAQNNIGRNPGANNLNPLPHPNAIPPLRVPPLPPVSSYNPPQLPRLPTPEIPTPPPNLFVPPTLSPDPLARHPLTPGIPQDGNLFSSPIGFGVVPGQGMVGSPPETLSIISVEEIPWDEGLLSKGGWQYRSSEMSAPIKFDVASFLSWILPGTKWCGDGNRAKHPDDLGSLMKTDRCCRKHDFCFDAIPPRQTKYGLTNTGPFVRLHCDCDLEFHRCLKRANTFASVGVGIIFFNILQSRCFKQEYPIVSCMQLRGRTCEQYELDKMKNKTYQWFANPKFPISTETLFSEKDAIKIGVGR